jgi:hypothetical protein
MVKTYAHDAPTPDALEKIPVVHGLFSTLHQVLEAEVPPSRELGLALTRLEEAAMWAIKAIVVNATGSQVEDPGS